MTGVKWIARTPPKRQVEGSNPPEPATILVLFSGFYQKYGEIRKVGKTRINELDPWSLYIYAMKAPMTRDRYKTRLAKFLAFIGLDRPQSGAREYNRWRFTLIVEFVSYSGLLVIGQFFYLCW
jgi:hypothetical protein